jgi:hypothetical protein
MSFSGLTSQLAETGIDQEPEPCSGIFTMVLWHDGERPEGLHQFIGLFRGQAQGEVGGFREKVQGRELRLIHRASFNWKCRARRTAGAIPPRAAIPGRQLGLGEELRNTAKPRIKRIAQPSAFWEMAKAKGHGIDRGRCCVHGRGRSVLEVVVLQMLGDRLRK